MWQGGHAPSPISIHAPPRGATCRNMHCRLRSGNFNSRPSARGDAAARNCPDHHAGFQFTPLREGRPLFGYEIEAKNKFQFTPLREGRRRAAATSGDEDTFQFTPLREGRHNEFGFPVAQKVFQFTPLREGRPVRGYIAPRTIYFNSRPSARGDGGRCDALPAAERFQFTPLREGRPDCPAGAANAQHFNSRPSARGDFAASESPGVGKISIHAPPRGATGQPHLPLGGHRISIHAPPRGATKDGVTCGIADLISIHAPPRGATLGRSFLRSGCRNFNSRPSARGDCADLE